MHQVIAKTAPPVNLNAGKLARRLSRMTAAERALLAHDLEDGTASLFKLSRRQAVQLARSSVGYVATISRASDAERDQLRRGLLSISALHNNHKRDITDHDVDRIVARVGADRLLAAIDRLTAPQFNFATAAE